MQNVTNPGESILIEKDTYLKMFQKHLNIEYANYIGSETSPPCRSNVRWIVSYCPHCLFVSPEQVNLENLEFLNKLSVSCLLLNITIDFICKHVCFTIFDILHYARFVNFKLWKMQKAILSTKMSEKCKMFPEIQDPAIMIRIV